MDNHLLSGRSVGAGHAPPAAIRGRSLAGKVPGRACRLLQTAKKAGGTALPFRHIQYLIAPFSASASLPDAAPPKRMVEQHPRTAPAHDLADALPHLGLVAVRLADAAERFGRYMRTVVHPRVGVVPQDRTVGAEPALGRTVMAAAV